MCWQNPGFDVIITLTVGVRSKVFMWGQGWMEGGGGNSDRLLKWGG